MSGTGFWLVWWNDADLVVRATLVLLVVLSLLSWSVLLYKAQQFARLRRAERCVPVELQKPSSAVLSESLRAEAQQLLAQRGASDALYAVVSERLAARQRLLRVELESGLTLLATIGNASPFIGLFGTVWGILHALQAIGGTTPSLELIAGPVAEALLLTAVGLCTALPAVIAYNLLVRRLRDIGALLETQALRLFDQIAAYGVRQYAVANGSDTEVIPLTRCDDGRRQY